MKKKLEHLRTRPALLTVAPIAYKPDVTHGAWSTPQWMRKLILRSPVPPTWDLFADQTNALTQAYCSVHMPFTEKVLIEEKAVFFYQPPYKLLQTTWQDCFRALNKLPQLQLWGLVPINFYLDTIAASSLPQHCCNRPCHVDYVHTTIDSSSGASFTSVLFFLSQSNCVCNYLHRLLSVCA